MNNIQVTLNSYLLLEEYCEKITNWKLTGKWRVIKYNGHINIEAEIIISTEYLVEQHRTFLQKLFDRSTKYLIKENKRTMWLSERFFNFKEVYEYECRK